MVSRLFYVTFVIQIIIWWSFPMNCEQKHDKLYDFPKYSIHKSTILPRDAQVTILVQKGISTTYHYHSETADFPFSTIVIPCTSPVKWSMKSITDNMTDKYFVTRDMDIHYFPAYKSIYNFEIQALEGNTIVNIYISTEKDGPEMLQHSKSQKIRLLPRQKRKRLTVKWNPSMVDPQETEYCLVVSNKRHYESLCSAQAYGYGINSMRHFEESPLGKKLEILYSDVEELYPEPRIICVGRKTQYTLQNLNEGQKYYYDVFAINHQSKFIYPYSREAQIFHGHPKPISLRDNKSAFVKLKKYDGKVVFRCKIGRRAGKYLDISIIPCGGIVEVEISTKDHTVISPKKIEGFDRITIPNPEKFKRYYIKIFALNREELKKISGVEVYVTTRTPSKLPLPMMPKILRVHEYPSLRNCNSVTIGWLPAPDKDSVHYCVVVKEVTIRETEHFTMPNQCGLDNRLKKSADNAFNYCIDVKSNEEVITHTVKHLKPGRYYIIQVTVKKPKGKTLSYHLLQVNTKIKCKRRL